MEQPGSRVRNFLVFSFLIVTFVGVYIYLRHGQIFHEVMHGNTMKVKGRQASQDYVKYYGQLPAAGAAECEGLVIYYPAKDGESFVPFPFKIATPEKRNEGIAKVMLDGLPHDGLKDYVNPRVEKRTSK